MIAASIFFRSSGEGAITGERGVSAMEPKEETDEHGEAEQLVVVDDGGGSEGGVGGKQPVGGGCW